MHVFEFIHLHTYVLMYMYSFVSYTCMYKLCVLYVCWLLCLFQNGQEKEGIVVHRENSTTPDQPPSVLHLPTTSDRELQGGISCVIRTDGTIVDLGTSKTVVLPPTMCSEGKQTVEMDTQETTVKAYSVLSNTAVCDSSFSADKEQVQVRQGEGTGTTGGTQERVPNPCLLEGLVFFIADYDRTMTSHIIEKWNEVRTYVCAI